jgi:hypothetical protein
MRKREIAAKGKKKNLAAACRIQEPERDQLGISGWPENGLEQDKGQSRKTLGAKADAPGFQVPLRHVVQRLQCGIQKAYKGP